jgi:hypothetical protein
MKTRIRHPDCDEKAKRELRSFSPRIGPRKTLGPNTHWKTVVHTMPLYFWNRIRQDQHGLCEWCNQPLFKEVENAE